MVCGRRQSLDPGSCYSWPERQLEASCTLGPRQNKQGLSEGAQSACHPPTFINNNTFHPEKRWLHSLCPTVKKTAWTREEDELLLSSYAIHSTKWSVIARQIPGRTDDACSKRYREALDPALKKGDWTSEEDFLLLQAYQRLGGRWGQIGAELQRSGLGCRNRYV